MTSLTSGSGEWSPFPRMRPDRAGRFVFLCDNFCGEGHDRMTGFLVVEE